MTLEKQAMLVITHEQVLDFSAVELEALSEKDLMNIYGQALNVCRPEYAGRVLNEKQQVAAYIPPNKRKALELLQDAGVDLSFMNKRRRR